MEASDAFSDMRISEDSLEICTRRAKLRGGFLNKLGSGNSSGASLEHCRDRFCAEQGPGQVLQSHTFPSNGFVNDPGHPLNRRLDETLAQLREDPGQRQQGCC